MEDGWVLCSWNYVGRCNNLAFGDFFNLIEVKPRIKREVWVNLYPHLLSDCVYNDKQTADARAGHARTACVKLLIDCEEGEGL